MNSTIQHYDKKYFNEHYGGLIGDPAYYELLSSFWARAIFDPLAEFGVASDQKVLDYGCGTGVVSAALANSTAFDVAPFVREFLAARGRDVLADIASIPKQAFDILLCSHSLEHYQDPRSSLHLFREFVRPQGYVVLILPIDSDFTPTIIPDNNQHLYCWNFQSITNLLLNTGWTPRTACHIHGPYLLRTLGKAVRPDLAVSLALRLGRLKRSFPSMLVLAQLDG
jgi:ubiquinone/menaquinone biosynthesis C-methylase UbiE